MNMVTIGVSSIEDAKQRTAAAFGGRKQGARIAFASVALLWKVLNAKRWELLQAMTGQGAMTIRAAARLVGRDVKAVHGDIHALLAAGLLDRTEDGRVVFPYDGIRVEFTLTRAA